MRGGGKGLVVVGKDCLQPKGLVVLLHTIFGDLSSWSKIAFWLQEQPFIETATCRIIVETPFSIA